MRKKVNSKKYQVFISSTYEDLKDERRAAEETIIRAGDFPVGMEAFPAADEEQFEFIKSIIRQCDYYILIIAGRYGSVASDGKSYTEKEYLYAVQTGVPVLVMLRQKRDELPANKTESDPANRARLEEFILSVSEGRLRKGWESLDGLKLSIREALDHAKATKARPGWIRGDQSASTETLEKLVAAQDENRSLKKKLQELSPPDYLPENIAGLETEIKISGKYRHKGYRDSITKDYYFSETTSFGEIFELLAPHLMLGKNDAAASSLISECVFRRRNGAAGSSFTTNDEIFQTIKIQLIALGLISVKPMKTVSGGVALFWNLTEKGEKEMIRRRAIIESSP